MCTVLFEILSALIAVLELCCYYNSSKNHIFYTGIIMPFAALNPVLPRRTYLFSAPVPHFILILAPAPAIYCNLKMYFNSSAVRNMSQLRLEVEISFSSSILTAVNINLIDNFNSGSSSQIISSPPAPASAPALLHSGSACFFYFRLRL